MNVVHRLEVVHSTLRGFFLLHSGFPFSPEKKAKQK